MQILAQVAIIILTVTPLIHAVGNGESACPCVDPLTNATSCLPASNGYCYSADYGSSCGDWDRLLGPVCEKDDPPAYCHSSFCFVDPNNCARKYSKSDYFPNNNLFYSYATCGWLDSYNENHLAESMVSARTTFRISYPSNAFSVWTLNTASNGQRVGSFVDLVNTVLKDYGIEPSITPMSEESLGKFDESWSACVHDVALNRTDLCVGNFWATSERRLMSHFTAEIYQTSFYLVTFVEESSSWASTMAAPFRPFQALVWVYILLLLVAVSGVILVSEHTHQVEGHQFIEHEDNLHYGALEAVYLGIMGFVSGVSAFEPNTIASKFLNIALGFFILILSATYTANMASFLVISAQKGQISTIPEGLSAGMRFCGDSTVRTSLVSRFPSIDSVYVQVNSPQEALANMDAGICLLAVLDEESILVAHAGLMDDGKHPKKHCNKIRVGDPVRKPISVLKSSHLSTSGTDFSTGALGAGNGREQCNAHSSRSAPSVLVGACQAACQRNLSQTDFTGQNRLLARLAVWRQFV